MYVQYMETVRPTCTYLHVRTYMYINQSKAIQLSKPEQLFFHGKLKKSCSGRT